PQQRHIGSSPRQSKQRDSEVPHAPGPLRSLPRSRGRGLMVERHRLLEGRHVPRAFVLVEQRVGAVFGLLDIHETPWLRYQSIPPRQLKQSPYCMADEPRTTAAECARIAPCMMFPKRCGASHGSAPTWKQTKPFSASLSNRACQDATGG